MTGVAGKSINVADIMHYDENKAITSEQKSGISLFSVIAKLP
jgi:hypothetical protein